MHTNADDFLQELSDRDWDLDRHGYTVNPDERALSSARPRDTTGAAATSEPGGGPTSSTARTNPHEGPENQPRLERGQPVSGISTGTPAPAAAEPAGANLARQMRDYADGLPTMSATRARLLWLASDVEHGRLS